MPSCGHPRSQQQQQSSHLMLFTRHFILVNHRLLPLLSATTRALWSIGDIYNVFNAKILSSFLVHDATWYFNWSLMNITRLVTSFIVSMENLSFGNLPTADPNWEGLQASRHSAPKTRRSSSLEEWRCERCADWLLESTHRTTWNEWSDCITFGI